MVSALDPGAPFGDRLRYFRERAGKSRPVLGQLVGRSGEWVKALETGRLSMPRLSMLLRLAELLGVDDLAQLTGDQRLTTASFGKAAHEDLGPVSRALVHRSLLPADEPPIPDELAGRVSQAWQLWHGSRRHRTAVAVLLPSLLDDARTAARRLDGAERRSALRSQAQIYHLAQLYLSFQPAQELVTLAGDRAMTAAEDADDPAAIAASAWYVNHVYRDAGQQHEARVQLALDAAKLLRPETDTEHRALFGLLHLAASLSYAKVGREGDAWRHWDQADQAVAALPGGYVHPWLVFGRGMLDAYAVTVHNDLMAPGKAARAGERLDLATMPSATRRSFHLIEQARAHGLRREPVATLSLLQLAHDEASETARYNLFTRGAVRELAQAGPSSIRRQAVRFAEALDLAG